MHRIACLLTLIPYVAGLACSTPFDCVSGICTAGTCQEPIVIDGLFADWAQAEGRGEATFVADPAADSVQAGADVLGVSAVLRTEDTTYFRWVLGSPHDGSSYAYDIFVDTDDDTSTGYGWRGSDLLIQGHASVFTYAGDGTSWAWTFLESSTFAVSSDSLEIEVGVPSGTIPRATIAVAFIVSTIPGFAIVELVPNVDPGVVVEVPAPPVCGDGVLHWLEECESSAAGDCCNSTCLYKPASTVCNDSLVCTAGSTCDGAGACVPYLDVCPVPITLDGTFGDWAHITSLGEAVTFDDAMGDAADPLGDIVKVGLKLPYPWDDELSVYWETDSPFNTSAFLYQVFVNEDGDNSTGYLAAGVDLLIENTFYFSYTGDGTSYSWSFEGNGALAHSPDLLQTEIAFSGTWVTRNATTIFGRTVSQSTFVLVDEAPDTGVWSLPPAIPGPVCGDGVLHWSEVCDGGGEAGLCCTGTCEATCGAACADRLMNNVETDVDCGGGTCAPCAAGLNCTVHTDCVSGVCDDDACTEDYCGASPCHANASCANAPAAAVCTCGSGYSGDGLTACIDVDECSGVHGCHASATCNNTAGSYTCTCLSGYTGNGTTCDDVDECGATDDCDTNAACNNTEGSYTCTCSSGYTGDGVVCSDVDECSGVHGCHASATCNNTAGSYTCTCLSGYTGNGTTCDDVDECSGVHGCHASATCNNTAGSYTCTCLSGYTGNGTTCDDDDECGGASHSCHPNAVCSNLPGSYACACASGYAGDGSMCTDKDECAGVNDCHSSAVCANSPGSYTCTCQPGFTGSGVNCTELFCEEDTRPAAPSNGVRTCDASRCNFTCLVGFVLAGSTTRACTPSGSWNGNETTCRHNCNNSDFSNGTSTCVFTASSGEHRCEFACPANSVLEGPKHSVCTPSNGWSARPACVSAPPANTEGTGEEDESVSFEKKSKIAQSAKISSVIAVAVLVFLCCLAILFALARRSRRNHEKPSMVKQILSEENNANKEVWMPEVEEEEEEEEDDIIYLEKVPVERVAEQSSGPPVPLRNAFMQGVQAALEHGVPCAVCGAVSSGVLCHEHGARARTRPPTREQQLAAHARQGTAPLPSSPFVSPMFETIASSSDWGDIQEPGGDLPGETVPAHQATQ